MANQNLPMYPDASGVPHMLPTGASALAPQAFSPTPAPGPARPPFVAPAVDPNMTMLLRNMQLPRDAGVAPNSFGGVGGIPPAPAPAPAAPAPAPAPAVGPAPSAAPAFGPTNVATPADKAYYAAAQSAPSLLPPQSPAAAAQSASDRAAIMGNVVNPMASGVAHMGAAAADLIAMPARAVMGVGNTMLRVPNAFGAGIPYIPEEAFGGSSSSLTPYSDRLNASEAKAAQAAAPAPATAAAPAAAKPAPAAAAAPAAPQYTPERLARAGVGADGGQPSPALADRLANPLPAASVAMGGAMPAGIRDPQAAISAGFDAQAQRAHGFMRDAIDYINGGSDIFDRATRGRAIGNILGAVMGPNNQGATSGQGADAFNNSLAGIQNTNTYANASMHGADSGLIGTLASAQMQANERHYETATGTVPTGTTVGVDPVTHMGIPLTTYGTRATHPGGMPGPISAQGSQPKFVPGRQYRDGQGNVQMYNADGTWSPIVEKK